MVRQLQRVLRRYGYDHDEQGAAAVRRVDGEPGALGRVVVLTLFRSIPIGVGLRLAGQRKRLVKTSVTVSSTITAAMLAYAYGRKRGWIG